MGGRIKRPDEVPGRIQLPRVGFIKTGYKDEKGYPKSVNYFIPTGKYALMFHNVYEDKPDTIQCVFWSDDPNEVCNERYEYRDQEGKLYAKGDGEIFDVWNGKEYQEFRVKEYPDIMGRVAKKVPNKKGWEVMLTLRFILPKVQGIAGYWEFTTRGEASTIPQIRNMFDVMLENRGYVKGIIFDLSVEFAKSQKPGSKSRFPVVNLIPNESEENRSMVKQSLLRVSHTERK